MYWIKMSEIRGELERDRTDPEDRGERDRRNRDDDDEPPRRDDDY